jgi:hypothetical protein
MSFHLETVMKKSAGIVVAMLCLGLAVSNLKGADEKTAAAPAAGQPSMEEMMAMMTKLGEPNENHKRLEAFVGTFNAKVQCFMMPTPETTTGVSRNEMIFGGRWLKGDYSGTMMGKPFKGLQLLGYDNQKKKYISGWIDDMSSGLMMAEGDADASGRVITVNAECVDPMTNQKKQTRMVMTIVSNDRHTVEMFGPGMDGKEMKMMSIEYVRAK